MVEYVRTILAGQFEASLAMLNDCVEKCPPEHWDGKIAKYAFWQVAYHTACYADLYLSPNKESFKFHNVHPQGWREFDDEFPSRRFEKRDLLDYLAHCHQKALRTFPLETEKSLAGPSGFSWCSFSRGELHIYNIRHIQHHTGQLGAYLRRFDDSLQSPEAIPWVRSGWR
jgi:hypothetical protein